MPAGFLTSRVYYNHDATAWYAASDHPEIPLHRLTSVDRTAAQSETEAWLSASHGMSRASEWTYGGDDETGASAVFAQSGADDALRTLLVAFWKAHRDLLTRAGVNVAGLTASQRALLMSQDVMLAGVVKALVDKELLTTADLAAARSAVASATLAWLVDQ